MSFGFGTGLPGGGPKGMRADNPPPNQADDMHAIRVRYCGPKTLSIQNLSLTANQAVRFDLTGTPVNAVVITSSSGQVNGYIGDYTSGNGKAAVTPHIVGSASIAPNSEVYPFPPADDYIFTFQEGVGGTFSGTVIFLYQ